MSSDTDILFDAAPPRALPHDDEDDPRPQDCAPLVNPLPPGLVMTEWAAGVLRQYLQQKGLAHFIVCYCTDLEMDDAERHLTALGEANAAWEPLVSATAGATLAVLTHGSTAARIWRSGALYLQNHQVVLARWYWVDEIEVFRTLWLAAAPTASAYLALRNDVRAQIRRKGAHKWEIVRNAWQPSEWLPRESADTAGSLMLDSDLRRRIEAEVIGFFAPQVATLYATLRVPYRRGVLLHGPPGNGKTSLIRLIGASLPEVPMLVLRPCANFNADALTAVLKRWTSVAPAALIIEDLDWLLKQVNISAFLNALDGIDGGGADVSGDATGPSKRTYGPTRAARRAGSNAGNGGLLLIATTNHPDQLDPAVNNRPGRFDVVVEISPPPPAQRREFFRDRLAEVSDQWIDWLAEATDGLSFAHLQEILRASGLLAIHAGRNARDETDLQAAVQAVRSSSDAAGRGFPVKPDAPFGLIPRRARN